MLETHFSSPGRSKASRGEGQYLTSSLALRDGL